MKLKVRLFGRNFLVTEKVEGIEKELPKGMNIDDYYDITYTCKNCESITAIHIKKGVHISDIITSIKCQNCEVRLEKI